MTSAIRGLYASRGTIIPLSNNIDSSARFFYSKALPNRSLRRRPLQAEKVSVDPKQSASQQQETYKVALDVLLEAQQSARLEQDLGTRLEGIRKIRQIRSAKNTNEPILPMTAGTAFGKHLVTSRKHSSDSEHPTYTRKSSNRSDDENNVGVSRSDCGTRFVSVNRRSWDHCSDPESWDDDF